MCGTEARFHATPPADGPTRGSLPVEPLLTAELDVDPGAVYERLRSTYGPVAPVLLADPGLSDEQLGRELFMNAVYVNAPGQFGVGDRQGHQLSEGESRREGTTVPFDEMGNDSLHTAEAPPRLSVAPDMLALNRSPKKAAT
ncbi:hypothetical protein [Streptomyces canus]|uniref:hypothetical protein n=1 Tax=Streptomyces canus TaxID=58343 RepID=UPI00386B2E9D